MASSPNKDTIPDGKDPLAGTTFKQGPKSKPLDSPPIDALIPKKETADPDGGPAPALAPPAAKTREPGKHQQRPGDQLPSPKDKVTVVIPVDLVERLRNAAFGTHKTLTAIAADGIRLALRELERENGGPFAERTADLRTGRPIGRKNDRPSRSEARGG